MLMLIWVILRLTGNKAENSSYHLWLWQLLLFTTYSVLLITSLTFQLLPVTHYSLLKVHHSSLKVHHSVPSMLLSVINIFFILFSSFILIICIYRKNPLVNLLTNGLLLFFHYYIVLIFYSLSFPLHQEYASYHMHLSYALELLLLQN